MFFLIPVRFFLTFLQPTGCQQAFVNKYVHGKATFQNIQEANEGRKREEHEKQKPK